VEDIESVVGPVERAVSNPSRDDAAQPAPGMLSRHYAPRTRLQIIDVDVPAESDSSARCGLLTYGSAPTIGNFQHVERLSEFICLQTCAINFFAALRTLDAARLDVIIARRFPDIGLGIALNDRLHRAANC
jgi:L-threonylcarbamoyladenylate synthase